MDLVEGDQPRAGRDRLDGEAAIFVDRLAVVARAEPDIEPGADALETPPRRPRKPCGRRPSACRADRLDAHASSSARRMIMVLVGLVADHEGVGADIGRSRSARRSAGRGDCRRRPRDRAPRRAALSPRRSPSPSAPGRCPRPARARARRAGEARAPGRAARPAGWRAELGEADRLAVGLGERTE
jgi:hypothetical protein